MRNRIAAIAGAVALVVVALVIRGSLTPDGDDTTSASGRVSGSPVVGCSPDLAAICDLLVERGLIAADTPAVDLDLATIDSETDAPALTGRLADGTELDGWIALHPSGLIADPAGGPELWAEGLPLATAPVGFVSSTLTDACGTTPDWLCLTEPGDLGVATGDRHGVDGLVRLVPLHRTLIDSLGDDATPAELTEPLRAVLDSPRSRSSSFAQDRLAMLTRPGTFQVLVGPMTGVGTDTAAGRLDEADVIHPDGPTTQFAIALYPRSERADAQWVGEIVDAIRTEDEQTTKFLLDFGVTPTLDPEVTLDPDLYDHVLDLHELLN